MKFFIYFAFYLCLLNIHGQINPLCEKKEDGIESSFTDRPSLKINVDRINDLIQKEKPKTILEAISIYLPHDLEGEGREQIDVSLKVLKNGNIGVYFIHDYLLDDSVKAQKYFFEFKKKQKLWMAVNLKIQWQCYRDPEEMNNWGITRCL